MTKKRLASILFAGLWESKEKIVAGRATMIEHLDQIQELIEELSDNLELTEATSAAFVHFK
ncbi:MAG TPA: hypothetical protein QF700_02945 [Prochlorococcus sp.]|nr:hypothetical protein [Prochlorococcus sp.]